MSDRDTITLPREVAYQVPLHELLESVPLDARLEIDDADGKGTRFIPVGRLCREAATALRTALAAEQPKHPGYIIGSHWLETAYSRICAGEAEADVLRDCGWERVDDIKALRRDAGRYWRLLIWLVKNGLLTWERCRIDSPASYGNWWILRKPKVIDGSSLIGYGKTEDAAIDAAMEASTAPASAAADASTAPAPEAKP